MSLKIINTFAGLDANEWTAICTFSLALTTIIAVVATLCYVNITKKIQEQSLQMFALLNRPIINLSDIGLDRHEKIIRMVFKNFGSTVAKQFQMSLTIIKERGEEKVTFPRGLSIPKDLPPQGNIVMLLELLEDYDSIISGELIFGLEIHAEFLSLDVITGKEKRENIEYKTKYDTGTKDIIYI
jgi:hypothetical protein